MRWYDGPLEHSLKNSGTKPFRNVIVEIKSLTADATKVVTTVAGR
jgi:hypothetical protein